MVLSRYESAFKTSAEVPRKISETCEIYRMEGQGYKDNSCRRFLFLTVEKRSTLGRIFQE